MNAQALNASPLQLASHPNELDCRRIERALKARRRYRYVKPRVAMVAGGYRIVSPCCSRNVDPDGGEIDVALLAWDAPRAVWRLLWRDHKAAAWALHSVHDRLAAATAALNADPERLFWQ
jgi:hypothetical protein